MVGVHPAAGQTSVGSHPAQSLSWSGQAQRERPHQLETERGKGQPHNGETVWGGEQRERPPASSLETARQPVANVDKRNRRERLPPPGRTQLAYLVFSAILVGNEAVIQSGRACVYASASLTITIPSGTCQPRLRIIFSMATFSFSEPIQISSVPISTPGSPSSPTVVAHAVPTCPRSTRVTALRSTVTRAPGEGNIAWTP